MTRLHRFCLVAFLLLPLPLLADIGVLIPGDASAPDPRVLSLDDMAVDIRIDNGDARVAIRQIFASHTAEILEGQYVFGLPSRATVSAFAVWDGVTRIPGVILERKRAEEIYDSLKQQAIDPGLLQQGEEGTDSAEASRTTAFSARIVPIPGNGTKRLEMEYHQVVPVENLRSAFALPLRPDVYNAQSAANFTLSLTVISAQAIRDFQATARAYPLQIAQQDAHTVIGRFSGRNVALTEDFAVQYAFEPAGADALQLLTYRNPRAQGQNPTDAAPALSVSPPGFFQASALLAPAATAGVSSGPRTVVALFDASLSMQWDKLERSFRTLETLVHSLRPADRFNVIVFNSGTTLFEPAPVAADTTAIERALAFVRTSRLRGGTDLSKALSLGLDQARLAGGERYLVVLSDGNGTAGPIASAQLAATFARRLAQLPAAERPRTYVFGVGDDVNESLFKLLTRDDGLLETVRSTETIDFKVQAFIAKLGARPLDQVSLALTPASSAEMIYRLDPVAFAGSLASWVGRYRAPSDAVSVVARTVRNGQPLEMRATAAFPAESLEHDGLPRLWARARVDALLDKIARDGEDAASIDEIITLARTYKFVTPYTSFLAAPRALLRPRVIKPGDPILRVATDPAITSVVAMFPFGLVKPLKYLPDEKIWQTRFLAPVDMVDGTYAVRLVMRDSAGHAYRESKTFVIASKPPVLRASLERSQARVGERVLIRARASASTRTIVARLYGAEPVDLRWEQAAGFSVGTLVVPDGLAAGRYQIRVTAEDVAHNVSSQELAFDVLP